MRKPSERRAAALADCSRSPPNGDAPAWPRPQAGLRRSSTPRTSTWMRALKSRPEVARTTASLGDPHAPADIRIFQGKSAVADAQLKYCGSPARTVFEVSHRRYSGSQKVLPSDQVDVVRKLAGKPGRRSIAGNDYADTARSASDRLQYDGLTSRPLSKTQAHEAAASPKTAADHLVSAEQLRMVKQGAVVGALAAGGVSLVVNTKALLDGEKNAVEGALSVLKATAGGGLSGMVLGTATVTTEAALVRVGFRSVARSSAPVAIAMTTMDVARDMGSLVSGEISGGEFAVRTGKHVVRGSTTFVGMEGGAAFGTAICPGVGTVLGGIIGGLLGGLFGGWLVE